MRATAYRAGFSDPRAPGVCLSGCEPNDTSAQAGPRTAPSSLWPLCIHGSSNLESRQRGEYRGCKWHQRIMAPEADPQGEVPPLCERATGERLAPIVQRVLFPMMAIWFPGGLSGSVRTTCKELRWDNRLNGDRSSLLGPTWTAICSAGGAITGGWRLRILCGTRR